MYGLTHYFGFHGKMHANLFWLILFISLKQRGKIYWTYYNSLPFNTWW